jgi:hypothetical protein
MNNEQLRHLLTQEESDFLEYKENQNLCNSHRKAKFLRSAISTWTHLPSVIYGQHSSSAALAFPVRAVKAKDGAMFIVHADLLAGV